LADFRLVVFRHPHEEVVAKESAEHVAVDEARQVAEHRAGRHVGVGRHQLLKGGLRLLARLGHRHRAHVRNARPATESSAVITGTTDPPTSIRLGTSPSFGYSSAMWMTLCRPILVPCSLMIATRAARGTRPYRTAMAPNGPLAEPVAGSSAMPVALWVPNIRLYNRLGPTTANRKTGGDPCGPRTSV